MHAKRLNMRSWVSVCLLILSGTVATSGAAQTPTVPSDRLAWTQAADQIGLFTFAILIDGARQPLTATCTAATDGFTCTAPLPAMTPGTHSVQVVAVRTQNGVALESAPSLPLSVTLVVITPPVDLRIVR